MAIFPPQPESRVTEADIPGPFASRIPIGTLGPFEFFWRLNQDGTKAGVDIERNGEPFEAGDRNVLTFVPDLNLVGVGGMRPGITATGKGQIETVASETNWCGDRSKPEGASNPTPDTYRFSFGTCCSLYMCDVTQYFSIETLCVEEVRGNVDVVKIDKDGLKTLATNIQPGWCAPPELLTQIQPPCTVNTILQDIDIPLQLPAPLGTIDCSLLAVTGGFLSAVAIGMTLQSKEAK